MSRFQRPLPVPHLLDEGKVNELFNYARNFDLDEIKLFGLQNHLPLSVINNKNENLIHIIISVEDTTVSENKRLKIITYLVNNGVHPDLPNKQGVTPLHYACEKQYSEIIGYLLELKVNPNTPTFLGKTPLHYLLSGIIKNWVNKKPRPLVIGKKDSSSEEFKVKKNLKLEIYKYLKDKSKLTNLDFFIKNIFTDKDNLNDILNNLSEKLVDQKSMKLDIANIEKIISSTIQDIKKEFNFNDTITLNVNDFSGNITDLLKNKIIENNENLESNIKQDYKKLNKLRKYCSEKIIANSKKGDEIDKNKKIINKNKEKSEKIYNNKIYLDLTTAPDYKKDYLDFDNHILVINSSDTSDIKIIDEDLTEHIDDKLSLDKHPLEKIYFLYHQSQNLSVKIKFSDLDLGTLDTLTSESTSSQIINIISTVARKNEIIHARDYIDRAVRLFLCILDREKTPYGIKNYELMDKMNQLYFIGTVSPSGLNEAFLQILRLEQGKLIKWYKYTTIKDDKWKEIGNDQLPRIEGSLKSINFYRFLTDNKIISSISSVTKRVKCLSNILDLNFIGCVKDDTTFDKILILFQSMFCKCVSEMKKLITTGNYPIIQVLKIVDLNNLDKYWSKIMKYHIRLLIYLYSHIHTILNGGLIQDMNIKKNKFDYNISDINEFIDNVNQNNIYLFLYHRFKNISSSSSLFVLSDYYENEILHLREDLILPGKILSYSYPSTPSTPRVKELIGGATIDNNSMFKYHTNKDDKVVPTEPKNDEKIMSHDEKIMSHDDFPNALKTAEGFNIFYNIYIFNIVKILLSNVEIKTLTEKIVKSTGFNIEPSSQSFANIKTQVILNYVKELLHQYLDSSKDKRARTILSDLITVPQVKEQLISQVENFDESMSLQIIDYEINNTDLETIIQKTYFPIMEDKNTQPDDFYFSNDYTKSDFELQVREIKFNKEALEKLLKSGANPYIEDKLNQSPLYLLTTNYCKTPLEILREIGIDLRTKNSNNVSPYEILNAEKELHLTYLNSSASNASNASNATKMLEGFTTKFYKEIEGVIESKETSGFNYPRYGKLGLNLMLFFSIIQLGDLSKSDIIASNLNNIDSYTDDYTLGQFIMKSKKSSLPQINRGSKINRISFTGGSKTTILEKWTEFTNNTFSNSPALFLEEIEKILNTKKIGRTNLKDKKALSYFINHRFYRENDLFEKTSRWVHLISKMILATQVQLIIGNLIFAHYQLKNPTLDMNDIKNLYEIELKQVILNDKYKQTLPDIIREIMIPKLVKSIALTFEDEIDKESHDEYTVSDMIQEIVDCLKILGIVTEKDMLLKVLQNQVNEYLDLYLPIYIQSLRCVAENYYRWVINLKKINFLLDAKAKVS